MEKKNIAIVYSKGSLISKEKCEIIGFLNSKNLLNNKGVANVQSTENIDIHWINAGKRNLLKAIEKYNFIKIFNIDVDDEILPNKIVDTNWVEEVINEIKKAFGDKELVYIPVAYPYKKYIEEKMVYKLDQNGKCFKTKEQANEYLVAKINEENEMIKNQIKGYSERLALNYNYLGVANNKEETSIKQVCIISKKFKDGRIEEIIGYAMTEYDAVEKIYKLNKEKPSYESYYYSYDIVDKV